MGRVVDRGLVVDVSRRLSRIDLQTGFEVGPETFALVGPSGSGKTSVLRAVAGLLKPDRGRIVHRGVPWFDAARRVDLPPEARSVALVFQEYALFPHLTVWDNVAYGLRRNANGRADRRRRVRSLLDRFGIAELADARPLSLSGGERQRVALARGVATDPDVLLLDEPLSALDAETKGRISAELAQHLAELHLPTILVSHDFEDVIGLAERIAVMEGGRIVQTGGWRDLLEAPASSYVAALTGVNYFSGTASQRGGVTEVRSSDGEAVFVSTQPAAGPVGVVVYPWDVVLSTEGRSGSARNQLVGPVRRVAGIGNRIRVTVDSRPPVVAEVTEQSLRTMSLGPGVRVIASWKATGTRLVPKSR
jgi:molybdate transport system ATP-binding protein